MSLHAVDDIDSEGWAFYRRALEKLHEAEVPFLVGGAYALETHTGIVRRTKDFDIFVLATDAQPALEVLRLAGYKTELTFPHWLGKAFYKDDLIDIIFNSGNGTCPVDQQWFEHAGEAMVLDLPLRTCPAEETIWQKAFILERDRCDEADVAHLLRACGQRLDWQRLLRRFGDHWRVLYAHLVLFGFIYPSERAAIPAWVMQHFAELLAAEAKSSPAGDRICNGTLLSATQYLRDLKADGYQDGRRIPYGNMTANDIRHWTNSFTRRKE